ncbi:hypothetical protein VTJ83DRAFT_862 [Remersonia thermophila]|uniref:Uncharacterized protein n=1 Tax=Remersonia thermophila TaxID=72144 RepID=A0ABR4DN56_9PEZI
MQGDDEARGRAMTDPLSSNPAFYDAPSSYSHLNDSLPPLPTRDEESISPLESLAEQARDPSPCYATAEGNLESQQQQHAPQRRRASRSRSLSIASIDYNAPESYSSIDDDLPPIESVVEEPPAPLEILAEQARARDAESERQKQAPPPPPRRPRLRKPDVSRLATQLYTISHLVFFSILGTLARLGLQALTSYPGDPVIFRSIWPNFAGCVVIGFLAEDSNLFCNGAGQAPRPTRRTDEERRDDDRNKTAPSTGSNKTSSSNNGTARARQSEVVAVINKKTIPLYIGLATGFCGSFTSFSAFMRDAFLALSNDLPSAGSSPPRNGGHSFLALLAVPVTTVSLSLCGLFLGAHIAIAVRPWIPAIPRRLGVFLDCAAVLLGWGCWLGAVLMSIFPPAGHVDWRGQVTFALVFAPLGCLARFYASLMLNRRVATFPLGTFAVNTVGTGVLGMAWDLSHSSAANAGAGLIGCQVLAGIQDGFCGCLTTVSTWVSELASLRRRHAYVYGGASILAGFAVMVAVMGGLRWSDAFEPGACA